MRLFQDLWGAGLLLASGFVVGFLVAVGAHQVDPPFMIQQDDCVAVEKTEAVTTWRCWDAQAGQVSIESK